MTIRSFLFAFAFAFAFAFVLVGCGNAYAPSNVSPILTPQPDGTFLDVNNQVSCTRQVVEDSLSDGMCAEACAPEKLAFACNSMDGRFYYSKVAGLSYGTAQIYSRPCPQVFYLTPRAVRMDVPTYDCDDLSKAPIPSFWQAGNVAYKLNPTAYHLSHFAN